MASDFFQFFALILSFTGYQALLNAKYKWDSTLTPIFVVSCATVILYIAVLCHLLQPCAWVILGGGWSAWLIWGFSARTVEDKKQYLINSFEIGFILFVILAIGLWFYTRPLLINYVDDFSHWYLMTKSLYLTNNLPTQQTPIYLFTYPPGAALFQFICFQLIGLSEANALFANNLLLSSAIILFFYQYKKNNTSLIYLSLIVFIAFGSFLSWGGKLTAEQFMGALIPCTVLFYYFSKNKLQALYQITPLLLVLVLAKPVGIIYAIALMILFYQPKKHWIVILLLIIAFFTSWQLHNLIAHLINRNMTYAKLDIVKTKFVKDIILMFFQHLKTISPSLYTPLNGYYIFFSKKYHFMINPISVMWILFYFIIMSAYLTFSRKDKSITKVLLWSWGFVVGYFIFLLITYLFIFTPYESLPMSGLYRYTVLPISILYFIILRLLVTTKQNKSKEIIGWSFVFILLIILTVTIPQQFFLNYYLSRDFQPLIYRDKLAEIAKDTNSIIGENKKLYVLNFIPNNALRFRAHDDFYPTLLERNCFAIDFEINNDTGLPSACYFSPVDFFQRVENYNYLIVLNAPEIFWDKYNRYFSQKYNTNVNSYLFSVDRKNQKFLLVKKLPALSADIDKSNAMNIQRRITPLLFFIGEDNERKV